VRILYFGNNWLGWQALRWLKEQGEEIAGLVVHPAQKRRYGDEMLAVANLEQWEVVDGAMLRRPRTLEAIRALRPDIGISVLFGYIIRPELLGLLPKGCLNLHPAYLPYNRGQYPNVWSIVEGTPSGTTFHYIDAGIDTGAIVAQELVPVELTDTGGTLYRRLERASLELFKQAWPEVRSGRAAQKPQTLGEGTYHRTVDVERIDRIDLDKTYLARDLINVLRARTFPPYRGAYFEEKGRRIYMRLSLVEAEGTEQ
jgi:methionyl-tRNA formyltransferase